MIPRTPATVGRIKPPFEEMHPGKAHSTSSPSFDFRYARPVPTLGPDAQRMMDEIREESLRIKIQLAAQREEEKRNAVLDDLTISADRRIATPKGKISRFSDVHIAEFKKMDSIAGHASAFRAQPGRFPVATTSLKRSQSKAKLGSREEVSRGGNTSSQPQSLENTPVKRVRTTENQYSSQPLSSNPATPKLSQSQSILSSITTPTQASLARAAGVRQQSQIPTLSHSPSKHSMTAPRRFIKSATINNLSGMTRSDSVKDLSKSPSKFDRFKSILRRPIISTPKLADTMQASALVTVSPCKPNLDKELPSIPATPGKDRYKSIKHDNITPRTTLRNMATLQNMPSPLKSGIPRSTSTIPPGDVNYPSLVSRMTDHGVAQKVEYPNLTPKSLPPQTSVQAKVMPHPPSVPGTFTFRSDQTINFGTSPRGFGASQGQSSIRQVRPSILPRDMPIPGSFVDDNKENCGGFAAISHGISDKKRRRVDSDEEEEKEVRGSPAKRHKGPVPDLETRIEPKLQAESVARKSKIPSPSKKGVLSLTRLNMLARPKSRK
jgi:hypothetical protein